MKIKKIISFVLIICTVLCCISFSSSAEEPESETFYYRHGVEVTVEYADGLDYDDLQRIADHLAGEELIPPEGDGIMLHPQCAAGNHELVYTTSTTINHNVYTGSYKCVRNKYSVATCDRIGCYYVQETLISSERINTCHG